MARAAIRDDLYAAHAALTRDVLCATGPGTPEARLATWTEQNASAVAAGDPDPGRDLGERALHVHDPVGRAARHPGPGRLQLPPRRLTASVKAATTAGYGEAIVTGPANRALAR